MSACGQSQAGVVRLAEDAEVLLHPLVVEEGSLALREGISGAGADSREDNITCFDPWRWEAVGMVHSQLSYTSIVSQVLRPIRIFTFTFALCSQTVHCVHTLTCTNGQYLR